MFAIFYERERSALIQRNVNLMVVEIALVINLDIISRKV